MRRRYAAASLALMLVTVPGCKSSKIPALHPVHGTVTQGGQPLKDAIVVLEPDTPGVRTEFTINGISDANGNVQIRTIEARTNIVKNGAPEGTYTVKVV